MHNLYFAAPLFCNMERFRNLQECSKLEAAGYAVYLPQRDGGELVQGIDSKTLYGRDIAALQNADAVVAYVDGRVPDEGMCFECGYAVAAGKHVIYVSTDTRSFEQGIPNVMLQQSGTWVANTEEALRELQYIAEEEDANAD